MLAITSHLEIIWVIMTHEKIYSMPAKGRLQSLYYRTIQLVMHTLIFS